MRQPCALEVGQTVVVHQIGLGDDYHRPEARVDFVGRIEARGIVERRIGAVVVEIAGKQVAVFVVDQRQQRRPVVDLERGRIQRQPGLRSGQGTRQPQAVPPLAGGDLGLRVLEPFDLAEPFGRGRVAKHDPTARGLARAHLRGLDGDPLGQDHQRRPDKAPVLDDLGKALVVGVELWRQHQQPRILQARFAARQRHVVALGLEQPGEPGEAVEAVGRGMRAAVAFVARVEAGADRVEEQQEGAPADHEHRKDRARRERRGTAAHASAFRRAASAKSA